jgi:hypothetical protein
MKLLEMNCKPKQINSEGKTALDYIPATDTRSWEKLEDVMVKCSSNPGFKRANVNTNSETNEDDEMDTYFENEKNEDDDENIQKLTTIQSI